MATANPIDRLASLASFGELIVAAALDAGLVAKKVTKRRKSGKRKAKKAKAEKPAKAEKAPAKKGKTYPVEAPQAA